ncbi:MAG: PKD domain-containing protein [Candidatus Delongbacteria bacterium]|jgi:gliding motility-associated-like protein|nr:PKD domain-containing protein [Candidatus Delongbacteria bacterium]
MKKLITIFISICSLMLLSTVSGYAQNPDNVLIHNINYQTQDQDMWGPGGYFSLDFDYDLIDIEWNESNNIGAYTSIFGQTFGMGLDYGFWGVIRSTFSIHGFHTGWIDIKYPIEVTLDFPDDYSFDPGETVTVNTWYEVQNGYYLDTYFPEAGIIALDLEFGLGMHMDLVIELFGTTTIPLMPHIAIPHDPVPGQPLPHDSIAIFYLNGNTGETVYPCLDPVTGLPAFCEDTVLPIIIPDWFGIGLTGQIDLPYVETDDWLNTNTQCLHAYGQDDWIQFELNILTFLSAIANIIPPPTGPAIANVIDIIDGGTITYNSGPVTAYIDYYILQISISMTSWMTQEFSFCPTIWVTLGFPLEVPYTVTDPADNDNVVDSGDADEVTFAVNNDLNFTYPCFDWDSMDIDVLGYDITPTFTNHTWDSLAFDFNYSVVWASIEIVLETPFKSNEIPAFDLPITYEDPETGQVRTVEASAPGYELPGIDLSNYLEEDEYITVNELRNGTKDITIGPFTIGPLLEGSIPLGYIPINWFEETWLMEGFYEDDDSITDQVNIIPLPELDVEIDGNNILCYGDTTGVITVTALNSTGPYTFEYSYGVTNTHMSPVDSIYVPAGYYYVTVSDVYGCEVYSELNVTHLYPPMWSETDGDDVLCHGDQTGNLYVESGGGAPPHTYHWEPSGSDQQNVHGVYAGWHYVTITDSVGCTHEDSVFLDEPDAPLSMTYNYTNVSCWGGYDGALDITVSGGTPPYYYEWSNGMQTEDLTNIPAGDYTVSITDSHNCKYIWTMVVIEPDQLIANIESEDVTCYGFGNGSIDLTVTGGTSPYNYQWNTGDTSEDLVDLEAGIYIVTITDQHDCQTYAYVQINEPDLPLTAEIEHEDVRCYGEGNGWATVNVYGGTEPYYYEWSNGEIGQTIDTLDPGTYAVTILDDHDCVAYDTVEIIQPDAPLSATITATDCSCGGYSDGSVHIDPAGGTPPYTFVWSNGSWQEDLINVPAGIYTVTVTDSHYCHFTISDTVDQPEPIHIETLGDQTICYGQTVEIGYSMITGGVPPYDVFWTHHGLMGDVIEVAPTETTEYGAFVIDSINCISDTSYFTVTVLDSLEFNVTASDDTVCPGDSVVFNLNLRGGGGSNWPYEVYMNDSLLAGPQITVAPEHDSVFAFTAWDQCHFDSIYIEYPIYTYDLPSVNINASVTEGCQPLTIQFNEGSEDIGQEYRWNFDDGDVENLSFDKSPEHTFHNATTYLVNLLVTSAEGCKKDSTVVITVYPTPDAKFEANRTNVMMSDPLIAFTNYTDGAYFYHWNFDDGTTSDQENVQHAYNQSGNFVVTLTAESMFGCIDTASLGITVAEEEMVYAPTAFSPNHDGINEIFKIVVTGFDLESYHMEIYNRWGEQVFVTDDFTEGWDGNYKEEESQEGVYSWYLEFDDYYGNTYNKSGTVTLIR